MFLSLVLKAETCSIADIRRGYVLPASYKSALYMCVADGILLYVGISISPIERVRQHLRMAPSRQRSLFSDGIKSNDPQSLNWLIAFPSGKQLIDWMASQHPETFNRRAAMHQLREQGPLAIADICESRIISTCKPIFNTAKGGPHGRV